MSHTEQEQEHLYMGSAMLFIVDTDRSGAVYMQNGIKTFPVAEETLREFEEAAKMIFDIPCPYKELANDISDLMTVKEAVKRYKSLGIPDGFASILRDTDVKGVMSCDTYVGDTLRGIILVPIVDMFEDFTEEQKREVEKSFAKAKDLRKKK